MRNDDLVEAALAKDLRDTAWYRCLAEIQDLRASGDYAWADEQLVRIATMVERREHVTEKQRKAIDAIRASERTPARNYQGFGRRWR